MKTMMLCPGTDGTGILFQPSFTSSMLTHGISCSNIVRYPNEIWSFDQYVDYLVGIANDTQPDFILGESFSGYVTRHVLPRLNYKPEAHILVASFLKPPIFPILEPVMDPLGWIITQFGGGQTPDWINKWLFIGDGEGEEYEQLKRDLNAVQTMISADVMASRVKILCMEHDNSLEVEIPTLCIWGQKDNLLQFWHQNDCGEDVEVVTIESAPHMTIQSNPKLVAAAIGEYLSRHSLLDRS